MIFSFVFLVISVNSLDLFIQSNYSSLPSDGITKSSPLSSINTALNMILTQSTALESNNIYLLSTQITYQITTNYNISQNLTISGNSAVFPVFVSFNSQFYIEKSIIFSLKSLTLIRQTVSSIENLFYLYDNSLFLLDFVVITSFDKTINVNQLIKASNSIIIFTNVSLSNSNFDSFSSFIELWGSSTLTFDSLIISNISLQKSTFIKIFGFSTSFSCLNSIVYNLSLNSMDFDGLATSFIYAEGFNDNNITFYNDSFININLNKGSLFKIHNSQNTQNTVKITSFVKFSLCFLKNLTTSYPYLFSYLDKIPIYLLLDDVYLFNNSIYLDRAALIYINDGDSMNLSFNKVILRNNHYILIESYYMNSIEFNEFYIWDHNIRLLDNAVIPNSYFLTYIESTINFLFYHFFLDGAYSDQDVAGIKIHINNLMFNRNGNGLTYDIVKSRNSSVNFTNCIFSHASSINNFWMDSGSGMSFHSDLPLNVYFLNVFFIGNSDNKGATCMESYGQSSLNWYIYDSFFINNTSTAGSCCLSLYVISFYIKNSYFIGNRLGGYTELISDFSQGTNGGAIFAETNNITIRSSFFISNAAYQAGAIYLYDPNVPFINISIANSTFQGNKAKIGGAISLSMVYHQVNFSLLNSSFQDNQGFNGGCFYFDFQSPTSLINILNSSFLGNKGLKGGVSFISIDGVTANFIGNTFDSNIAWNFTYLTVLAYGGVHYLSEEASSVQSNNINIYRNNTSSHAGGVYSINRGLLIERNGLFINNSANEQGGSIYIRNSAECQLYNSLFNGEISGLWGGSVYLCENSNLYIQSTSYSNCLSKSGGVFYIENPHNITIYESNFQYNKAYEGAVASIDSSSNNISLINNSYFYHPQQKNLISAGSNEGFIEIMYSNIIDNQCPFIDYLNSKLVFTTSYIYNQDCSASLSYGCLIINEDSWLKIQDLMIFNSIINTDGSLIYITNSLYASIDNLTSSNVTGGLTGSFIYTDVYIKNSVFNINNTYGCFSFTQCLVSLVDISFNNLLIQMSNINEDLGSFIYFMNSFNISINNSIFINNTASNGGAITARNGNKGTGIYIKNCQFIGNNAQNAGGAIYIYSQEFYIENCLFSGNKADTSGAIYFTYSISNNNNSDILHIINNTFINNIGYTKGGAIYFEDNYTSLSNNTYKNNTALYASDIGTFPVYFRIRIYHISTTDKFMINAINETLIAFDSKNQSFENLTIEDFPTGQPCGLAFVVDLLDFYKNPINSINVGLGHLQAFNPEYFNKTNILNEQIIDKENLEYDFSNKKITIQGEIDAYNRNGTFYFSDMTIYATPSSYINFFISNDVLIHYYPQISDFASNFLIINNTIGIIITVHLRECLTGELYMKDINYCSICPMGKYSLNKDDKSCSDCPNHALCLGGDAISIAAGYWRAPEKDSVSIYQCFKYEPACLGGVHSDCQAEYEGPLCMVCRQYEPDGVTLTGYTKLGKYCVKCLSDDYNALFLTSLLILFIFIIYMIVRSNMKVNPKNFICEVEDERKTPSNSLLFKILIDHIQILGITENIGFDVPDYFSMTNDVQSNSVYFFEQMLSFDCFVKNKNLNFSVASSIMFIRVIIIAILPFMSSFLLMIFWICYYYIMKQRGKPPISKKKTINLCISSIIVTVFLLQPTILNTMSSIIGCIKLGNVSYALSDMNLTCWGSDHIFMVVVFAIPCLVLWILIFPLVCLISIAKHRKKLKDENTVLKFGFLYNGFHEKTFYWGFLKFFQKLLIILLRSSDLEVSIKMFTLLLILYICASSHKNKNCYVHKIINKLEFTSNSVALFTLFFSLYYLIGVSDNAQIIIFVIILVVNIYFIIIWFKTLLMSQKNRILSVMNSVKKNFSGIKKITEVRNVKINLNENLSNTSNRIASLTYKKECSNFVGAK